MDAPEGSLNTKFGPKLQQYMQYCENNPGEVRRSFLRQLCSSGKGRRGGGGGGLEGLPLSDPFVHLHRFLQSPIPRTCLLTC